MIPRGLLEPAGYIVMRHSVREDRPTKVFARWIDKMPGEYHRHVLEDEAPENDGEKIATLKDYRSLMGLAHEANKPIFNLTSADGAMGSHFGAAKEAGEHFATVARSIASRIGLSLP